MYERTYIFRIFKIKTYLPYNEIRANLQNLNKFIKYRNINIIKRVFISVKRIQLIEQDYAF